MGRWQPRSVGDVVFESLMRPWQWCTHYAVEVLSFRIFNFIWIPRKVSLRMCLVSALSVESDYLRD